MLHKAGTTEIVASFSQGGATGTEDEQLIESLDAGYYAVHQTRNGSKKAAASPRKLANKPAAKKPVAKKQKPAAYKPTKRPAVKRRAAKSRKATRPAKKR